MMKEKNYALRVAIAACFGVAASQGIAAVDVAAGTGAVKVAKEIVSTTTSLTDAAAGTLLAIYATPPAGITPTNTNPVYLKLNLSNGAKFASTPNISCSAASAGIKADATAISGQIQAGGLGFSNVTFVMSGTTAAGTSGTFVSTAVGSGFICSASVTALTISGLNNVTVSATFEYTNGLQQTSSNAAASYVTFTDSFAGIYSASTATSAVVDATSGSDNWVTAGNLTQGTAILGFVRFDSATTTVTATITDAMNLGAALAAGSASVTISGPAIEAMKAAQNSAGVYLTSAAGCTTVVAASFQSTATNAVTFTGLTTANITGGLYVCGNVTSGTQQILTGQITGVVGGTALSNVTISFGTAGNLQNIGQNGTTKNAYLVNASSSPSKTSVIRLVNTGGNSGTIRATAYSVDASSGLVEAVGAVVGTANTTIATLAANQSVSLTSKQLETLLGYTPAKATDKYRVVFSAGLAAFKVLNFTKDVSGAVTLSQQQDD